MEKRIASGIMLTLILTSMLTLASNIQIVKAEPTTWTVDDDGPADFHTIQEAIDTANPEDTIYVYDGTYYESIVIGKSVSLVGENTEITIIDGGGIGTVVSVTANNVSISQFTIQYSETGWLNCGIYLSSSNGTRIHDNNITNNGYGICLSHSSENKIMNNNITNNEYGILLLEYSCHNSLINNNVYSNEWSGIGLAYSSNDNTVLGNNVYSNSYAGILVGFSEYNILSDNNASNNGIGVLLIYSSNNALIENYVHLNSGIGIKLEVSDHNTLESNEVSSNSNGIALASSNDTTVSANNVHSNQYGIWLDQSSLNTVVGNNVSDNHVGIYLTSASSNTVFNNNISDNYYGIMLYYSTINTIAGNDVYSNHGYGIALDYSSVNTISDNQVTNNFYGISLGMILGGFSSNNTLRNNVMVGNTLNFMVWGVALQYWINDVDASNTVDGEPVYYWVNQHEAEVPSDAGYVALVNCTEITVKNLTLKNNNSGLLLAHTQNSSITNNNIANNWVGIYLSSSSNNNVLSNNNLANNGYGIYLYDSSYSTLAHNTMTDNSYGIYLGYSSKNNTLFGNIIANNSIYGVFLWYSSCNMIYHNNFVNNTCQARLYQSSNNVWDDGYPSGGNYWSDYLGIDADGDGLGDTPYDIDANNQDRYPLVKPWSPPTMTKTLIKIIRFWDLPEGTENSLTSKLEGVLHLLDIGNENGAVHKLMDFMSQVEALRGKKLSSEQADYLVSEAKRIIDSIKE